MILHLGQGFLITNRLNNKLFSIKSNQIYDKQSIKYNNQNNNNHILFARPSVGDYVIGEVDDIIGSVDEPAIALKVSHLWFQYPTIILYK